MSYAAVNMSLDMKKDLLQEQQVAEHEQGMNQQIPEQQLQEQQLAREMPVAVVQTQDPPLQQNQVQEQHVQRQQVEVEVEDEKIVDHPIQEQQEHNLQTNDDQRVEQQSTQQLKQNQVLEQQILILIQQVQDEQEIEQDIQKQLVEDEQPVEQYVEEQRVQKQDEQDKKLVEQLIQRQEVEDKNFVEQLVPTQQVEDTLLMEQPIQKKHVEETQVQDRQNQEQQIHQQESQNLQVNDEQGVVDHQMHEQEIQHHEEENELGMEQQEQQPHELQVQIQTVAGQVLDHQKQKQQLPEQQVEGDSLQAQQPDDEQVEYHQAEEPQLDFKPVQQKVRESRVLGNDDELVVDQEIQERQPTNQHKDGQLMDQQVQHNLQEQVVQPKEKLKQYKKHKKQKPANFIPLPIVVSSAHVETPPPTPRDTVVDWDANFKRRGRPRKQSTAKYESVELRDTLLKVGSPVYAPYPGKDPRNETYYWGRISKKTSSRDGAPRYDIDFDDGDKLRDFSAYYLFRMEEIVQECMSGNLKVLLRPPRKYISLWNSRKDGPTLRHCFQGEPPDGCGNCWQCTFLHRPCGACHVCRKNSEAGSLPNKQQICIQTMCMEIAKQKSQEYGILPPTWNFYFDDPSEPKNADYAGLWITKERVVKKWKSFEKARRSARLQFLGYSAENFYRFVGLESCLDVASTTPSTSAARIRPHSPVDAAASSLDDSLLEGPRRKKLRTNQNIDASSQSHTKPAPTGNSLAPSVLYRLRCGICEMCTRETCKKCHNCVLNDGRTMRYPLVCFRKICERFQDYQKKQTAPGLEKGWTFYFSLPRESPRVRHQCLRGLIILSPNNEKFTDVEAALEHQSGANSSDLQQRRQQFYSHIGVSLLVTVPNHTLVDKSFFKEWMRVDGTKVFLTGKVAKVEEDLVNYLEVFTVVFDQDARERINRSNHGKLHVPESLNFAHNETWDACLRSYEISGTQPDRLHAFIPFCERWETPHTYSSHMVPAEGTILPGYVVLPCVEITYKGYLLRFSVKKSTIPNARFGVFLSIRPLIQSDDLPKEFRLPAGKLLDFGIYAPFRMEDTRSDHEHFIKSIIHSYKNEMYCFVGRDHDCYLDITDDCTGELHAVARRHIPPYVNELRDPTREIPSVHARLDPEGALHYLLGHPERDLGDFRFLANGSEEEIFVDYGPDYEMVRLRERYPRIALSEAEAEKRLRLETAEYVDELDTFTAKEVDHFVKTYSSILSRSPPPQKQIILRIIAVAMLLRRRAKSIQIEFYGVGAEESICDNGVRNLDMEMLVQGYDQLIRDACHLWENYHGSYFDMHRDAMASDLCCLAFSKIWPQDSLERLTHTEFRDRLSPLH